MITESTFTEKGVPVVPSETQPIITLSITYVRMKVQRGDWFGDTVRRFRSYLFDFAAWVPQRLTAARVQRRHIEGWLTERATNSASSARGRLTAVRGLFRWLHHDGQIPRDPTAGVIAQRMAEPAPRSFSDEDVETLFATAHRDPRELAIISLEWNEGFRCSEVAKALIEDVNWRARTISVRGKFGRGQVSRTAALSDDTVDALRAYLATIPARSGHIIRNQTNPQLGIKPHTVWAITDRVIKDAGLKWFPGDGRSSHAGRHSAATQALEAGVPTEIMLRQFGWKSDAMIQRYAKGAALDLHVFHDLRAERRERLAGGS